MKPKSKKTVSDILDNNAIYLADYPDGKVTKVKPEAIEELLALILDCLAKSKTIEEAAENIRSLFK